MAWSDLSSAFGFETTLTDTQMQNLRDNIAAAFAKDSGAPVLANNYITETMISSFAVTESKIDSFAVTSTKVASFAITETKINSFAVTESKIDSFAITETKIDSFAVIETKISSFAVTETKIDSGAVTTNKVGDAAISQSKLKTSTGEVSATSDWGISGGQYGEMEILPGGEYGFYPQIRCTSGDVMATISYAYNTGNWTAGLSPSPTYATCIRLGVSVTSSGTAYARQRYVTSSGEIFWMFITRNKKTKAIISTYSAPDHPCFGNGGNPDIVQHPFPDIIKKENNKLFYKGKEEKDDEVEMIVTNPDKTKMLFIRKKIREGGQDSIKTLYEHFDVIEDNLFWPEDEVTVGLPEDFDWHFSINEGNVKIKKRKIPKPDYIISAKTKLK